MTVPYTIVAKGAPEPQFQLTVITVCWNALADLKPTVESVLAQKAKGSISIEHVVVDGASTDGTPEWLAEQLAAGNIEHYVSEPDRGIYDAMNKGINLARGEVLAFLNAGDCYRADADLAACLLPICRGDAESVAATAVMVPPDSSEPPHDWTAAGFRDSLFIGCPCCHQAYFASARAYRAAGGYRAQEFRCGADFDIICRITAAQGLPAVSACRAVDFAIGGYSYDNLSRFADEYAQIMADNWRLLLRRAQEEPEYGRLLAARVALLSSKLGEWQAHRVAQAPRAARQLGAMCTSLLRTQCRWPVPAALLWLKWLHLPWVAHGRGVPAAVRRITRVAYRVCGLEQGSPYLALAYRGANVWS